MLSGKTVKDYNGIYSRQYLMKIELLFASFKDDEKDFLKNFKWIRKLS